MRKPAYNGDRPASPFQCQGGHVSLQQSLSLSETCASGATIVKHLGLGTHHDLLEYVVLKYTPAVHVVMEDLESMVALKASIVPRLPPRMHGSNDNSDAIYIQSRSAIMSGHYGSPAQRQLANRASSLWSGSGGLGSGLL